MKEPQINLNLGDCMDAMAKMPDNAYDLAIVDPPYGIGEFWLKSSTHQYKKKKKWNDQIPSGQYFMELMRVSKNQIIFGGNYYTDYLPARNSWLVWDKFRDYDKTHMSEGEMAWTSFNIPLRICQFVWDGARKGNETGIKTIHPCQKPVNLYRWILDHYAQPGDRILDTHLGSGSIAIACNDMGFDLDGWEIDVEYYEAALLRYQIHASQLQLF